MTEDVPPPLEPTAPSTPKSRERPWPLIVGLVVLGLVTAAAATVWVIGRKPSDAVLAPPPAAAPAAAPTAPEPAALPPGAIQGKVNTMYEWSQRDAPDGVTYVIEGFIVRVYAKPSTEDGNPVPAWRLTAPDGQVVEGEGTEGFQNASASFAIGRLDPRSPQPQLLFSTYTGGAHCCTQLDVADFIDGKWRKVDFGYLDGEPAAEFPKDVDGDGWPELVNVDNRFLYAFDGYAQSRAPTTVTALRGGEVVDVSADPRYRKLYEADLTELRKDCEDAQNSACAAYVATATRLGRTDEAWDVMERSYDRESDWLPTTCRKPGKGGCADEDKVEFGSFPEALRWFLGDAGYMPPAPLP